MQRRHKGPAVSEEPQWYKDAIIYELHVRSYFDSTGDGIGDFRGLAQKLDYIRDLGVTALWLLPFYPSPLRDDGYDIADYTDVHPAYGSLSDFKIFLREAHSRGLRVITELVVNHTSDQHPWFQRARRSPPGSAARDFYVWSDSPDRYKDARIIFKDFETSNWSWDPVAGAYFWHRFYSHQPDLNFANPQVRKEITRVMDFWLDLGVDGFRLDAVPYLHEREGTSSENLPETHAELRAIRSHIDEKYRDRMLLAEANQWPEDSVAYFGNGDECHMAFHFPLMPRMFMALRMEDRYPIVDILRQTPDIPEGCQWAIFLRNHDELTLEMVTDEERDYMYRMYAKDPQARINLGIRRRLAPLLGNDIHSIELMNGLLFSLPGTPVIYYGDEIGMGDNIYLGDRNGVRTPMQWSRDRNAGFSRGNSQKLFLPLITEPGYSYETLNVEAQQDNLHSLLWKTRQLILLRRRFKALSRGTVSFLYPQNRKILAFVREHSEERVLVVANLSRFTQFAELELSAYKGLLPTEAFGLTRFPMIGDAPYFLSLGPRSVSWFVLRPPRKAHELETNEVEVPTFRVTASWANVFEPPAKGALEEFLARYLPTRRWFGAKSRALKATEVFEVVPIGDLSCCACVFVRVEYVDGDPEVYLVPMAFASAAAMADIQRTAPRAVFAKLIVDEGEGVLFSAVNDASFCQQLLETIARRRRLGGRAGELIGVPAKNLRALRGQNVDLTPNALDVEQSNTSVLFGQRLILKLFRRLEEGINPDVEVGRFLSEETQFENLADYAGHIEYRTDGAESITLAVLQGFVQNEGDAWQYTLDHVSQYFERAAAAIAAGTQIPPTPGTLLGLAAGTIPALSHELIGPYLEAARLLGQRTAEMHLALAGQSGDAHFRPESFTLFYQRSLLQSFRNLTETVFEKLASQLPRLVPETRVLAERVLSQKSQIMRIFAFVRTKVLSAQRTRIHGDYHLGQVLWTGRDFVIVDFEGEPARPMSARRIKRSPLRDVSSMIRSLHYASHRAMTHTKDKGMQTAANLELQADHWFHWTASAYLRAYLRTAGDAAYLPRDTAELQGLLDVYLLEKAIYELGYEIDHRPDWVALPLRGIEWLLSGSGAAELPQ
jgi:maltose alpha-D-glucosyltransferase/alpha-amylase